MTRNAKNESAKPENKAEKEEEAE
jgi:hypothetical protein